MTLAPLRALLPAIALFGAPLPGQDAARHSVRARLAADSLVSFDGRRSDALRTTLTVPRGRAGVADTLSVDVGYLRLTARVATGRAPIVFLMGGPGVPASVIGRIPPYWTLFQRLRDSADVILLDPRGVGLSRPALDCPAGPSPPPDFLASLETLTAALRAAFAPCVTHWRDRGIPAEVISVDEVAADIEDIRRQLGVARVSLLGFSYGTRIALQYVERFPDHVDRVALQGTLGFADGVRLPVTLDSLLDRVSTAAARDSVGRGLVPDLRRALVERFAALERQPLEVPVARLVGDTVRITVGRGGLQAILTGRLADPRLPALVASLAAGDTRVLSVMVAGTYRDLAAGGGSLFGRAVYCSAPGPEAREQEARRQGRAALLGEVFDNVPTSPEFCRAIGITPGARASPPTRVLDRPALFVSGALDDRTPPGNAERAARYFATAHVVTVENGGHELLPVGVVQELIVRFLWAGRVDSTRLTLPPPRFVTVAEALQPPARR